MQKQRDKQQTKNNFGPNLKHTPVSRNTLHTPENRPLTSVVIYSNTY